MTPTREWCPRCRMNLGRTEQCATPTGRDHRDRQIWQRAWDAAVLGGQAAAVPDLSSGGRAKMLTETHEPYEQPDPEGVGMLGLFATEFQVQWEGESYTTHRHFDEARAAVRDNQWGQAEQIDRIETVWVRARERATGESS